MQLVYNPIQVVLSPSSRRAWIEMQLVYNPIQVVLSPSSRRAWIEIKQLADITQYT